LQEASNVDGQNVAIEYRWAEGQYDRLHALAAYMVRRQVAVMGALGPPSTLVARAVTPTVPIVFDTRCSSDIWVDAIRNGWEVALVVTAGDHDQVTFTARCDSAIGPRKSNTMYAKILIGND
jgi:hypothetical protein